MSDQGRIIVAERNATAALELAVKINKTLEAELAGLRQAVSQQAADIQQLTTKYNLLLTKNFNGGSTSE